MVKLETDRLVLRRPTRRDIGAIHGLAGDRRVVRFTTLPWPYERKHAAGFVKMSQAQLRKKIGYNYVIERTSDGALIGAAGLLNVSSTHRRAELGYWLGVDFWHAGYASEAARRLVVFGFKHLRLHRIHALTVVGNDASAELLRRLAFKSEGVLRHHFKQRGRWKDLETWGLLARELA
jgi:RimJ/RimL family protein N-acetyltransferase